jgi:hypothetical protein
MLDILPRSAAVASSATAPIGISLDFTVKLVDSRLTPISTHP